MVMESEDVRCEEEPPVFALASMAGDGPSYREAMAEPERKE